MDFKQLDDGKLLVLYEQNPELALEILGNKYSDEFNVYNRLCFFFRDVKKKKLEDFVLEYKYNKEIHQSKYIWKEDIGSSIHRSINELVWRLYESSHQEIPFKDYREYLLLVIDKSDRELLKMQNERFNYIEGPITNEIDQIYDSLVIIESYLFDIESNGDLLSAAEKTLIDTTVEQIKRELERKDVRTAKLRLVALQMLMNMDIRFYHTLKTIIIGNVSIKDYVFFPSNGLGRGRNR